MRVAILSDIHSNLEALTKAFTLIDELQIDEIHCLGDIVGYGGNPNECIELVRSRVSRVVMGNHDMAATDPSHAAYFTKPGRIAAEWTNKVLTAESLAYLDSLPFSLETEHSTLVHANPSTPLEWRYIQRLEDAHLQFSFFTTPLCFVGHTHVPFQCGEDMKSFSVKRGVRFLINVGSVGQPRDANPHLSFGVLDTDTWSYDNVRSPYDIEGASRAILDQGLPKVLANRLFRGL